MAPSLVSPGTRTPSNDKAAPRRRGAIAVCAEAAGAMARATEQTVEYLKTVSSSGSRCRSSRRSSTVSSR